MDRLVVRGAREHNLKDVHLDLPRDALIVFTGLSGSGKSSLAFDTIFAEGQRRYVESLSAYARQFLGQMDKPDVDFIEGLSPAVSIDQKSTNRNPRSTVGTITEVYDYLRLLYARAGQPHCPNCGKPISRQTPQQIVDQVLAHGGGHPLPGARPGRPGAQGRVRRPVQLAADPGLLPRPGRRHRALADRAAEAQEAGEAHDRGDRRPAHGQGERQAPPDRLGGDRARAWPAASSSSSSSTSTSDDPHRERTFSEHLACVDDGLSFEALEPRSFSFNSPFGACPECTGIGTRKEVDPELVVPDPEKSLGAGRGRPVGRLDEQRVLHSGCSPASAQQLGFSMDDPVGAAARQGAEGGAARLAGPGARPLQEPLRPRAQLLRRVRGRAAVPRAPARGHRQRLHAGQVRGLHARRALSRLPRHPAQAGDPRGQAERPVDRRGHQPLDRRRLRVARRPGAGGAGAGDRRPRAQEIQARLSFLVDVGLDYLSLDRPAATLAGGEAQRIRLATQIGSGLVGVLYVLDEPSIGLHQRDNTRLIETLVRLRDMGNTLIVVEHDEDTIKVADWIVDIGPGAGEHGGEIVVSGSLEDLHGQRALAHRRSTCPAARRSRSRRSGASRRRAASWSSRAPASTTSRASTSRSRWAASWRSPASPARASPAWSTTSSTRRWPTS